MCIGKESLPIYVKALRFVRVREISAVTLALCRVLNNIYLCCKRYIRPFLKKNIIYYVEKLKKNSLKTVSRHHSHLKAQ